MEGKDNKGHSANNEVKEIDIRQLFTQLGISEDKWQQELRQVLSLANTSLSEENNT